jgi:hypothetical protein
MAKKSWNDLTPTQQKIAIAGGVLEAVLTGYVLRDLSRRPKEQVRGPKLLWRAGSLVQPVGPVAYLAFGRR